MGKTYLLDCTLRDGGYINDWAFGEEAIHGTIRKLEKTGIEFIEIGFLKGDTYDPAHSLFPDTESCKRVLANKQKHVTYVAMADLSAPLPLERYRPRDEHGIDGVRVIFKKSKLEAAYDYCKAIKALGYELFVNFVSTDQYSDKEFIEGLEKFNALQPTGVTIVDTFGMIKRKHFLRLAALADNNLDPGIALCYHAHNNLQQAFGNAEALVDMNLSRDVCIDACVFGMGRGAGNLNLELFAGYMNDNYGTNYRIAPMLEIMDEYLSGFYRTRFWGYSLPLYLSASHGCHPNYAIYLAEKNTLSEKAFNELLQQISPEDKGIFNKDKAEQYYRAYLENFVDDKAALQALTAELKDKTVLLLAPGKTLASCEGTVRAALAAQDTVVMTVNFYDERFAPDYVFCSNLRRYGKFPAGAPTRLVVSSNIKEPEKADYVVNFSTYVSRHAEIVDNSGLMALRLLEAVGVREVRIAGMDGFSETPDENFYDQELVSDHVATATLRNSLISEDLSEIRRHISLEFLTPTHYNV